MPHKTGASGGEWILHRSTRPDTYPTPDLASLSDMQRKKWFGDPTPSEDMRRAWDYLSTTVASVWPGKTLKAHPGITGLHLMQYTLPASRADGLWYGYPKLPNDAIAIIRQHSPQHRHEWIDATTDRLVYYDMRDAYASLLAFGIPAFTSQDEYIHDEAGTLVAHADGFYRCDITVPQTWDHIGLIPVHGDNGKWHYPHTPGETFETWISDLDVLTLHKHGWPLAIRERIVLNRNSNAARPLRPFAEKIVPFLELAERKRKEAPTPTRNYIRNAWRAIINIGIGCMHSKQAWEDVPPETADEDETVELYYNETGDMAARKPVYHTKFRDRWYKPEWSSAIYRREIARITKQALTVPMRDLVCINGDAIYLRTDPHWTDATAERDQKVGAIRVKADIMLPTARTFRTISDMKEVVG